MNKELSCFKFSTFTLLASVFIFVSACSPSGYSSREGMTGAMLGTALGSGVGWLLGNEVGDKTENVALNAAIGGGIGLLAGALMHERNISLARKRAVVIREAALASENQKEIDALRQRVDDASSWGRNEVKPWDERYIGNEPDRPFQGSTQFTY